MHLQPHTIRSRVHALPPRCAGTWHTRVLFTCCQYSSREGSAEKYPVSCTIWSSWKMLHMGSTSMSGRTVQPHRAGVGGVRAGRERGRACAPGEGACTRGSAGAADSGPGGAGTRPSPHNICKQRTDCKRNPCKTSLFKLAASPPPHAPRDAPRPPRAPPNHAAPGPGAARR